MCSSCCPLGVAPGVCPRCSCYSPDVGRTGQALAQQPGCYQVQVPTCPPWRPFFLGAPAAMAAGADRRGGVVKLYAGHRSPSCCGFGSPQLSLIAGQTVCGPRCRSTGGRVSVRPVLGAGGSCLTPHCLKGPRALGRAPGGSSHAAPVPQCDGVARVVRTHGLSQACCPPLSTLLPSVHAASHAHTAPSVHTAHHCHSAHHCPHCLLLASLQGLRH